MDRVYSIGLCIVVVLALASRKCNAIQTCEDKALKECVVQYATGFADPKYQKLDDLKLHCLLDKVSGRQIYFKVLQCVLSMGYFTKILQHLAEMHVIHNIDTNICMNQAFRCSGSESPTNLLNLGNWSVDRARK